MNKQDGEGGYQFQKTESQRILTEVIKKIRVDFCRDILKGEKCFKTLFSDEMSVDLMNCYPDEA